MATSIFDYNSTFREAAKKVKFRLDVASKEHYEIFAQPWYKKHFKYGAIPHLTKDFKTIIGKLYTPVAASTISDHSAEPLRMNQGFTELDQSMFTHAHAYRMSADEIRDLLLMSEMAEKQGDINAVEYIADVLMNHVKAAVEGVDARLDMIILSALSNGGQYTFTQENDPGSPFVGKTIEFGLPESNKAVVGAGNEWVAGNESKVDPIKEIEDVLAKQRGAIKTILIDRQTLRFIQKTDAMKGYVNSVDYPNQPLSISAVNRWMADNGYPTFEIVEREVAVQNGSSINTVCPYKAGQLVFLPDTQIGTIETCLSDAEIGLKSEGVKYANYGRTEVRRLTQGEKENATYCEITKASLTATPAMDTIDRILVLDTTK
jgi:hypothetical protein